MFINKQTNKNILLQCEELQLLQTNMTTEDSENNQLIVKITAQVIDAENDEAHQRSNGRKKSRCARITLEVN